ncbi:MAG: caspase family protein [Desulfobulbaceae bacterium]
MKRLLLLTLFALCASWLPFPPLLGAERGMKPLAAKGGDNDAYLYKGSYAFLVGNGRYSNGWEPLPGAEDDIHDVARALELHGFEVSRHQNLTKAGFEKAFTEFVLTNGQDKDNRLLFYYAGHGFTEPMATGEELGYLVMVDAPLPDEDQVGFSLKSVDMQSLITQARLIKSKHVLFLFDSCFSGSILNTRALVRKPRNMSRYAAEPVRQFITAGRANEAVPDRSYFKIAFVNMLEGREEEPVKDGMLTGEELAWYLKSKVTMYNPSQHPQYGKIRDPQLDQGDFIFLLPEGPVDVEIKIRPLPSATGEAAEKSAGESPPAEAGGAEASRPEPKEAAPAMQEPPPATKQSVPPEEPAASEPPPPRIAPLLRKKTLVAAIPPPAPVISPAPALAPEIEQYLRMLQGANTVEKRRAAKLLYDHYPYGSAVLRAVSDELRKGYNSNLRDKQHVDAMAWLCRILGRSRDDAYLPTVREVLMKTDSRKIRKYAGKSIRFFPGHRDDGSLPGDESDSAEDNF